MSGHGIILTGRFTNHIFTTFAEYTRLLRRFLKIKAYTILLAWLTIFAHGAIPHNHDYLNIAYCKELIHISFHKINESGQQCEIINQSKDDNVCHASGLLFGNFNHDNIIVHYTHEFLFNSNPLIDQVISVTDQSFVSDHFHGTTSFRAPPAA
jgi:hypothetical protein